MSGNDSPMHDTRSSGAWFLLLERVTAAALVAVLLSMGWMVLVVYVPACGEIVSTEVEVLIVIGLLTTSLILVSVVALLHTRRDS
jgi:hypothetical protein